MSAGVLSIGSNLGDRMARLRDCVALLGDSVRAVSPVYETAPWGGVEQDEFLNAIVLVADPNADARVWLHRGRYCESAAERSRTIRWGPRSLDVDVIDVEGTVSDDPELTLPHPRAHLRAFVLVPWLDVQPDAVLPGYGRVDELVAALAEAQRGSVRRRDDLVLESP